MRDAWLLRQPGDATGPAGNVLAAWRRLAADLSGAAAIAALLNGRVASAPVYAIVCGGGSEGIAGE